MEIKDVTPKELTQIEKELEKIGFTLDNASQVTGIIFFTRPIESDDLENVLNHISPNPLKPNHFKPDGYRYAFFGQDVNGHIYVTSNLSGTYRGYRCKNTCSMTFGNVFSYGSFTDILSATKQFVKDYTNRNYNRTRS
jgi:hypothetical protein